MIARMLVKPFGTIWKLKDLCVVSKSTPLKKFYRFLYGWYQFEHGSAIDYRAKLNGVPTLPFGTKQIIINPEVEIGKNCIIYPQVMIGTDHSIDGIDKESPVIGNNCFLGAGVKIFGAVKIGNNVRIMANCVITEDIPDNSIVSVNPPHIETKDHEVDTKHYRKHLGEWHYIDGNNLVKV